MEYQKIANLLDNASNQPSKFRTKNLLEINSTYTTGSDIKIKTAVLRSSFVIMLMHIYLLREQ